MAEEESIFVTITRVGHHDMLVSRLYEYFLTNRGVDFAFQWGERTVRTHRVILDLFLSSDELAETVASEPGCSPDPFFEFLYNGTLTVPEEQLENLMAVAKKSNFTMLAEGLDQCLWPARQQRVKIGSESATNQADAIYVIQKNTKSEGNDGEPVEKGSEKGNSAIEKTSTEIDLAMEVDAEEEKRSAAVGTRKDVGASDVGDKEASNRATSAVKPKRKYVRSEKYENAGNSRRPSNSESSTVPASSKPSVPGTSSVPSKMIICPKCNYKTPFEKRMADHLYKHNTPISKRPVKAKPSPEVKTATPKVLVKPESPSKTKPSTKTQDLTDETEPPSKIRRMSRKIRQCPHCPYTSGNLDQYQVHQAKHDSSIQIYKCLWCSKRMIDPDRLARHSCMRLGGANLHSCPHCDFKHLNLVIFRAHVARHDPDAAIPPSVRVRSKPKPTSQPEPTASTETSTESEPPTKTRRLSRKIRQCPHCPYTSGNLDQYQVHQAKHDSSIEVYKCQFCSKRMIDPDRLARHSCMRLGGANLHSCPHCDFKHLNLAIFRIHLARHDPDAVIHHCKDCKHAFADEDSLSRHCCKRSKSIVKQWHQCPFCPFKNRFAHQVRYHIEGMHSGTKPHRCEHPGCNYGASLKASLNMHVKIAHLNIKPFVCETCGYRAYNQSRLKHHQRVHSDERNFKCSECDRTFRDSKSRKEHQERHFGAERTHVCHLCGRAFYQRSTMRTHLKCVHKSDFAELARS